MKIWEYQGAKQSKKIRCLHPLPSFVLKYETMEIEKSQSYETMGIKKIMSSGITIKKILRSLGKQTSPFFAKLLKPMVTSRALYKRQVKFDLLKIKHSKERRCLLVERVPHKARIYEFGKHYQISKVVQ